MSQLTIQPQTRVPAGFAPARRRTLRTERMVPLRSVMPRGLVTIRHDVPEYLPDFISDSELADRLAAELNDEAAAAASDTDQEETTPKVEEAAPARRVVLETAARKG
jgi:hypothetical protein